MDGQYNLKPDEVALVMKTSRVSYEPADTAHPMSASMHSETTVLFGTEGGATPSIVPWEDLQAILERH